MHFDSIVEELHPALKKTGDCRFVALCLHSVIKGVERGGRFAGRETILQHLYQAHDLIPDTGPMSDELEQEQDALHPQLKAQPLDGAVAVSLMLDSLIRSPRCRQHREELYEAKQHVGQAVDALEAGSVREQRRNPPLPEHMAHDSVDEITRGLAHRFLNEEKPVEAFRHFVRTLASEAAYMVGDDEFDQVADAVWEATR